MSNPSNPVNPANPSDVRPPQKSDGTRTSMSELSRRIGVAWNLLMGRPFSPGVPVEPLPGTQNQLPRQFQFTVAQNTQRMPRGENPQYTPFSQLRQLATSYDIAALCIATRVEQVQGLQWSIVPKDKRKQADTKVMNRVEALTQWWKYPDRVNDFASWIGMIIYDVMSVDAMTLYRRRTRSGHLYALEVVDGATMKPIIDNRGRTVGYQQVLWGETVSDYSRAYADSPDEQLFFTPHDMIYRPRYQRSFTPYGFPPTEWVIIRVNTALRKQSMDLAHFTDGNVPNMLASPPDGLLDPNQLREFEEMFNADLSGNDRSRAKIKFVPFNLNLRELMPFNYSTEVDRWMMNVTVAAFGVTPSELGFTEDVNRATALAQESITYRRGIEGISSWLKNMFDRLLADDFRSPDLEWQWHFGKADDRMLLAQLDQIYSGMGVISPEEVRALRFGNVLEGPSPAAEAAGVGKPTQQMLGADKLSSSWTSMQKNDETFADLSDNVDISKSENQELPDTAKELFPDPFRSALASAIGLLLTNAYLTQRHRISDAIKSENNTPHRDMLVEINAEMAIEPQRIAKTIRQAYADAIRMGVNHGLQQIGSTDIVNSESIDALAYQESLRFGTKISQQTQSDFVRVMQKFEKANYSELIQRVYTPNRIQNVILSEVNRLFNLGIQLAGRQSNIQKMKWVAECPVCESRNNKTSNIQSDVIPGFHQTCKCIIELVKE
jgi:hypothetical protein